MRWLKWLAWTFLILLALLVVVPTTVLLTDGGNRWLWAEAKDLVPGLDGELVEGNLGQGWHFKGLSYEDSSLSLKLAELQLAWTPSALLAEKLQLDRLVARGLKLDLKASQQGPAPAKAEGPMAPLELPMLLVFDDVDLQDVRLRLPGQQIRLKSLGLSGLWDQDGIMLNGPEVTGLDIQLSETAGDKAAGSKEESPAAQPLQLPVVQLPVAVRVEGMVLKDSHFSQGDMEQQLAMLSLSAKAAGSDIHIQKLALEHELGTASLKGQIRLKGQYPLSLALDASLGKGLLDGQLNGETLALRLDDSLADLKLGLAAKGPLALALKARAQPLKPELPFDAELNWQETGWPLAEPQYRLGAGELSAKGSLKGYRLNISTSATGPSVPNTTLALDADGDAGQLAIRQLALTLPRGKAQLDGMLAWRQGLSWQGKLSLDQLDPSLWLEQLPGAISGTVPASFKLAGDQWQLAAQPALGGSLAGFPLSLKGDLALDQALEGQLQLALANGPNRLLAKGSLGQQLTLKGEVQAQDLSLYGKDFEGALAGHWTLQGDKAKPQLDLDLGGQRLTLMGFKAARLKLAAQGELGQTPKGRLQLNLASLKEGGLDLKDIALSAQGGLADHKLALSFKGAPVGGELHLSGGLKGQDWQGNLSDAAFDTAMGRWHLDKPLSLAFAGGQLQAGAQCWRSEGASACLTPLLASADKGQGSLRLEGLELARLKPFFPDQLQWQASLKGEASFGWQQGKPSLDAHIETSPGRLLVGQNQADYRQLALVAKLAGDQLATHLDFQSDSLGQLALAATVTDPQAKRKLDGQLSLKGLKLGWLAPLLPQVHSLSGEINGEGRLGGSLAQPLFFGKLALSGGGLDTNSDILTLSQLDTELAVDGAKATLSGSALVGKGKLALSGDMDWQQPPIKGQVRIQGDKLEAGYPGYGKIRLSPDLSVGIGEANSVEGKVVIPWARIKVKELPQSAVSASKDVVVVTKDGEKKEVAVPLTMHLGVELGDDVRLEALGLKTKLKGGLALVQEPGKALRGNGEIRLADGTYKAYGQNLQIRTGSILFTGALDSPNLKLEAIRNPSTISDPDIVAGVRVTGEASQPKVELFSEPDMTQAEQLSYLLRGKGLDSNDQSDGNAVMQAMLLSAGLNQVGGLVTGVAEGLGLSDVAIDTSGSGDGTQVNISGYLAPGLQLEYGVGVFSSVGEVRVTYELLPRLYLQAVNGVNQALDIFYKFEF
ncbi:translocation/assembly module TamB [Gallaecimonas kandeliae]|uniref:autotransporter assembly complex protein TamB n=1 Tax=Gallaecimonas kandeliae TaxID=3029055 RepID=UPI00264A14AC|nr:translocation/assembly module TamB domain-containing protein [Gallaecimonas kandeliae]WKE64489.1 translocation/assembly module TamB [Gallaecimonas kandeliae]